MAVMFMLSYRLLLQRFVLGSDWSLKSTFHDDLIKMQLTSFWKTSGITSVIMGYHGNRRRIVHYPESSLSIVIEMIPELSIGLPLSLCRLSKITSNSV